jgi:NAD(P)-dependent dehydrogenase (short-subunit alcohol dehydrogenase family)
LVVQLDVSNVAQVRQAVGKIEASFGKVDILVNNAGIGPPNPIDQVSETDFDATVAVNLKGTFFVSQAIGKLMVARRSGRIINLSSQAGFIALPTESVYCMTKAAIAHLTKCFALEWGPFNVNVNAVAPTFIKTPGTEKWLQDPAFKAKVISSIPLGRVGEPSDVTGAVLFLASSAASLITGTTLLIDGGWTVS